MGYPARIEDKKQSPVDDGPSILRLEAVSNATVNIHIQKVAPQLHGMVERDVSRTIELRDSSGFQKPSRIKIGRSKAHRIGRDLNSPSKLGRIGQPPAIVGHVRDQVKDRLSRTPHVRQKLPLFRRHSSSLGWDQVRFRNLRHETQW